MTVQCQHFVCHQCECESCNTLRRELDDVRIDAAVETLYATKATERAEAAEAELADIKESFRQTVEGRCAPDEWHCSCVPALRAEVERLRVALGQIASIDPHVNGVGLYCRELATAVLAEGDCEYGDGCPRFGSRLSRGRTGLVRAKDVLRKLGHEEAEE